MENKYSIQCGKTTDEFLYLQKLCAEKAIELSTTIEISDQDKEVSVPFWTTDIPELIGVAYYQKSTTDIFLTRIDFSESTL